MPIVNDSTKTSAAQESAATRRQFLRLSLAAMSTPLLTACATDRLTVEPVPPPVMPTPIAPSPIAIAPPLLRPLALDPLPIATLPSPDLSQERVVRFVAGLRPYRRGTVRIESEQLGNKMILHHYGHGGAGVTLSWGTAQEAANLLRLSGQSFAPPARVAVIGGGVIGLTTAVVLLERGYDVTVYAKQYSPDTTSDLAGAQFAPSLVACDDADRLGRWVRTSAERFLALRGDEYGVYERPNYATPNAGPALRKLPTDLFPTRQFHRLPFAGAPRPGRVHQTLLIEPPIYLPRMMRRVREAGGVIQTRTFSTTQDITALQENIVINCMGLGSADLFPDRALQPMRGQLVHLEPQDLPYLLSHSGYLFPRSDVVVLGGTVERGVNDTTPSEAACRRILETHRHFFA